MRWDDGMTGRGDGATGAVAVVRTSGPLSDSRALAARPAPRGRQRRAR